MFENGFVPYWNALVSMEATFWPSERVPLKISYHLYFLHISNVWSILHHGSVGRVQSKQCNSLFTYTFLAFFFLFFIKRIVFLSFSFLFLKKYQISITEY